MIDPDVHNIGSVNAQEIIQIYYNTITPGIVRYLRRLCGFTKVYVPSRSSIEVTIPVQLNALERWNPITQNYVIDTGVYDFFVGDCANSGGVYDDASSPFPCNQLSASVTIN